MTLIIDMDRPFEKMLKKGYYIIIKCHNTPGDNASKSYETNPPIMEEDHLKSMLRYYFGGWRVFVVVV